MRPLVIAIAVSAVIFSGAAQNRGGGGRGGGSQSGSFGGTHNSGGFTGVGPRSGGSFVSPPAGSIINPGLPNGLNWNNAWRGYSGGYRNQYNGGHRDQYYGGHRGYGYGYTGILAYPVFVGSSPYDYNYLPPGYNAPPPYDDQRDDQPQAPAVVINQNFIADRANPIVRDYGPEDQPPEDSGIRHYQNAPPKQAEADATIYLIAFRDHTVVPALGWWIEGATLKYVNLDHDVNQASVDLIDRDLSKKLNAQRNIDFTLPSGPAPRQ